MDDEEVANVGSADPEVQLRTLINEFNRQAMRGELSQHEIAQIREFIPQMRSIIEERKRRQWLLKSIGMFLLAAPAVAALWQGLVKLVEWIRGQ